MEKAVFIFQYLSVQICLKEAASGADNPEWFTQADGTFSSFQPLRIYFSIQKRRYFSFFKNYCDEEVRQASTESWNWQKETEKKIIREEEEENEYINK